MSNSQSTSNTLSSGAKIGIGVGVCARTARYDLPRYYNLPAEASHACTSEPRAPVGFSEAPSYPPSYPMSKRAQFGRSIYEVGNGKVHEAPEPCKQELTNPYKMWVAPTQGG
jgi:hypothetical protein